MKRVLIAFMAGATLAASAGFATVHAAAPGPGSQQCVPGQNGNPQPGAKPNAHCPGN